MTKKVAHSVPPFFIFGCGRSGTTLLRVMLNNHPEIAVPPEALCLGDYFMAKNEVSKLKKLILNEYEIKEWGLRLKRSDFVECKTNVDIIKKIHELYAHKENKTFWGQKTPRLIRYAHLIKEQMPKAKFICLIRDPRAVVSSLIYSDVHKSNLYYASKRWIRDVGCGIKLKDKYPEDVLEIKYEELVSCPKEVLESVCSFLKIKFDREMLKYYKSNFDYGPFYRKIHKKLQAPPDKTCILKWKRRLSYKQIIFIESLCRDLMCYYNYHPTCKVRKDISYFHIFLFKIDRLLKIVLQFNHFLKHRPGYILSFIRRKIILKRYSDIFDINF